MKIIISPPAHGFIHPGLVPQSADLRLVLLVLLSHCVEFQLRLLQPFLQGRIVGRISFYYFSHDSRIVPNGFFLQFLLLVHNIGLQVSDGLVKLGELHLFFLYELFQIFYFLLHFVLGLDIFLLLGLPLLQQLLELILNHFVAGIVWALNFGFI